MRETPHFLKNVAYVVNRKKLGCYLLLMNRVVKIDVPQPSPKILGSWLFFFPFNYIMFLSQLFFINYQKKMLNVLSVNIISGPNWGIRTGSRLCVSRNVSKSDSHTFLPLPPIMKLDKFSAFSFLLFLLPVFDWIFPFCQMQSAFLFWLSSELFGFVSWKI